MQPGSLFWWPSTRHFLAFTLALIAVCALGFMTIPGFPAFKDLVPLQASLPQFIIWSVLIAVANAYFLYEHANGDYLDQLRALRPIAGTFIVLSIAFPLAWVVFRLTFGGAAWPDLHALVGGFHALFKRIPLPPAALVEWTRAAHAVFVGEAGLTAVLLYSGLWKNAPKDTLDTIALRNRVRPSLRRLFCTRTPQAWTKDESDRLVAQLEALAESAQKLRIRQLTKADQNFAEELAAGAAYVAARTKVTPNENWTNIASTKDARLKQAAGVLIGKSIK